MKKILVSTLLFLLCTFPMLAQHSIQSMVFDAKTAAPVEMGAVRLIRASDSTFVQGLQTDLKGYFNVKNIKPGNYILKVSMLGYNDYVVKVTMAQKDVILKNIQLQEDSHLLKEVEVRGSAAQVIVKGDTTEFNAAAFKTQQNAMTEDLLRRLPGVEVGTDGSIKVNGQSIKNIRVNGKKFFEGDIEMATKNIPAEMIDKIQVLDQKSDMAQMSGFEDGNTERIINLTFKANRRKGVFGNFTVGGGSDVYDDQPRNFRYDSNAMLSIMNGETQSTVIGGANNVNTSRSSRGRNAGQGGGGGMSGGMSMFGGGGNTALQNIAFNTATPINKKLTIGGDLTTNHSYTESNPETDTKNFLSNNTTIETNSKTKSYNEQFMGNLRAEIDWKKDSLNSFLIQPGMNIIRSFAGSDRETSNTTNDAYTSSGITHNNSNSTSLSASLNVLYSHKFGKGRVLTTNFSTSYSKNNSESFNKALTNYAARPKDSIDQHVLNNTDSYSFYLRTSFVQPLWNNKSQLETAASIRSNTSTTDQNQYNKDIYGNYTNLDLTYSNNYFNRTLNESLEANYKYTDKVYNLTLGAQMQPSQSYSNRIYSDGSGTPTTISVVNFAPNARLQYYFNNNKRKFLRLDYRGQSRQPSITQLQPVKNNSNPLSVSIGNPLLNPQFSHNLNLMFTTFNDSTFAALSGSLQGSFTKDAMVQNSIYDATGKRYGQTVNSKDAPYQIGANIAFNTPIFAKNIKFNTNTSASISEDYAYTKRFTTTNIDADNLPLGDLSKSTQYSGSEGITLSYQSDFLQVDLKGSLRLSNNTNSLTTTSSLLKDWSGGATVVMHLPYNINFATDLSYVLQEGYTTSNVSQMLWNASIDKTVFNSKGVIALKVFDILHDQKNFTQSVTGSSQTITRMNIVPTYAMLSFTYKLASFPGGNTRGQGDRQQRFGGGDMPAGMPAGGFGGGGFGGGRNN